MAKLYEMQKDGPEPGLTGSLARSFKESLILPAERRFNLLEMEIASLREQLEHDTRALDTRLEELKKVFRLVTWISLASLAGIITTLVVLFSWY